MVDKNPEAEVPLDLDALAEQEAEAELKLLNQDLEESKQSKYV